MREKYDYLIQLNLNMHGKKAVQNVEALSEIKNLLSQQDFEIEPKNITEYHRYMTRQIQLKPAPFATGNDYDVNNVKANCDLNAYAPKCKEMNDFVSDVKKNPNRWATMQRDRFMK